MKPNASLLVLVGIPALAVFVAVALVVAIGVSGLRRSRDGMIAAFGAASWLALTGILARSGVLAHFDARPPPLAPFMLLVVLLPFAIGLSRVGDRLSKLPLAVLVGIQAFRLPLELVMHQAAREGVMPPQMSFGGYNYDIVIGALALPLALLVGRGRAPRAAIVLWNVGGFVTLGTILVVAFLSTPQIHAFGADPTRLNTWVAFFPFVWLLAGPVVFALTGHLVVTRALGADRAIATTLQRSRAERKTA